MEYTIVSPSPNSYRFHKGTVV